MRLRSLLVTVLSCEFMQSLLVGRACSNPNERSGRAPGRQWFPGKLPQWPTYDTTTQHYINFGTLHTRYTSIYCLRQVGPRLCCWVCVFVPTTVSLMDGFWCISWEGRCGLGIVQERSGYTLVAIQVFL